MSAAVDFEARPNFKRRRPHLRETRLNRIPGSRADQELLEQHHAEIQALNEQLFKAQEVERTSHLRRIARRCSPADHIHHSPAGQGKTPA